MYGAKTAIIRNARGYTQQYMAQQLDMAQNTYSRIEKDESDKLSDELLDKIATCLGVTKEDIKSPTPVIMNLHDDGFRERRSSTSPPKKETVMNALNGTPGESERVYNERVINALLEQLRQKDEQILRLTELLIHINNISR